uniref:Uncharacterized protein n=1 Tax=Vitis vinifera TaxID=29760 RepID=F6H577_VITVI
MKHNHYHLSRPQFSHVVKRSSEFSSFYSDSLPINKLYLNLLSVYHHRYPLLSLSLSLLFRRFPARFPLFPVKPSLFFLSGKGGGGNMTNTKIVYPKSENCQRLGDGGGPARR